MGRTYIEYLPGKSYCCSQCQSHIACKALLVWPGYMGHRIPAFLFRETVNLEIVGNERKTTLSTGDYTLVDVHCRVCGTYLGWKYVSAPDNSEKYKQGMFLLEQAKLIEPS